MPSITLENITNYSCKNLSLSIRKAELLVVTGATGAGKTTLLNVIAGLAPYDGDVRFDGTCVNACHPAQRNVGYLFQSFALFPHLTVRENIAFGLRVRNVPGAAIDQRVKVLLEQLHIAPLEKRYPNALSGGEKQRVALARTLAPRPKILLLDEPFNSLDQRTAKFLRLELKNLQQQLSLTAVYVTHNQPEAFEMGDRIAVVHQGRVEQVGTAADIIFSPRTSAVSTLFGAPVTLNCSQVTELDFGLGKATCGTLSLIVPYAGTPLSKIAVLPSGVHVSKYPITTPVPNRFEGRLRDVRNRAPIMDLDIDVGGTCITAELPARLWEETGVRKGDTVYVAVPLKAIRVLAA